MAITVSGEGRCGAAPDVLTLGIGINLQRDGVAQATADAARLATGLIDALTAAGVDDSDIQTSHYSIQPVYDHHRDGRRLIGYGVSNQLQVKIRHLERAGTIIDAAVAAGGNEVTVDGVGFSLEDDEAVDREARRDAWGDARSKAEQLADLAGLTLGPATAITESFSPPTPVPRYQAGLAMAEGAGAFTPMQPGELEVVVNIEVTFGLG